MCSSSSRLPAFCCRSHSLSLSYLVFNGTLASFDGKDSVITMQGDTVMVSRGPAAGMIAIKHVGTNGDGWFCANSAHPLENPNYFTNMLEMIAQVFLPIAMLFALGFLISHRRFTWVVYGVMTLGVLCLLIPTLITEVHGNPAIAHLDVSQPTGAMEGKGVRFGPLASAYWSILTTVISTGSVNSMHDSSVALSGTMELLGMMTSAFMTFAVIIIITALSFFPALALGPLAEYFSMK